MFESRNSAGATTHSLLGEPSTGVLWVLTGTHPCDTSTQAEWWRYQSASSYVRCACAGVVVHVVVLERACLSALLLERCRLRPSSGQHVLEPWLCVCQVSKLVHFQLERETLGTVDDSSIVLAVSLHQWATPPGMSGALVLHEKLVDTVGDTLVDLTRPGVHVAERLLVRDTEDHGDIVCAVSVEHVRRDLELTTAVSHCS